MIPCETVPCETCGTPTPFAGTRRCKNCWEVERRLPDYTKSPKGWDFVRQYIPKLDDWVDGNPDAWDYDAVLREKEVIVEWCDTLVDGNGNEHRAGEFAGWGFYWKHGAIHIGQCSEQIARKAAAVFVSLWLRGVSASFCDKIMSGMIWFWKLQERPERVNSLTPLDLALLFHETYERLAPSVGYTTRPEPRQFNPDSPNGRLMIAVCEEILLNLKTA
jgi:hypothetical protein